MTGPEHYNEAEECIGYAQVEYDRDKRTSLHARAQVHATLALTDMVGALLDFLRGQS